MPESNSKKKRPKPSPVDKDQQRAAANSDAKAVMDDSVDKTKLAAMRLREQERPIWLAFFTASLSRSDVSNAVNAADRAMVVYRKRYPN